MEESESVPCPCCGYLTFDDQFPGSYAICPVCFWEDDPVQYRDPFCAGGANTVSLLEARQNFQEFGAAERIDKPYVRDPLPDEIPKEPMPGRD